MILTKIELTDFRSYNGHHVIDLSACDNSAGRNIVAVGGLNGAGKTSFLEAVTFSLLGVSSAFKFLDDVDRRGPGRQLIDRTFDGLLNREAREQGTREAQVAVTLQDGTNTLTVSRTWYFDARGRYKQQEHLIVTVNGSRLGDEEFDDYLKNQIPPEVVTFFMFDGEKIQEIAQDEVGVSVVKGIDSLLGFHVLEALTSDMEKLHTGYRNDAQKENKHEVDLAQLRTEETKLQKAISELEEDQLEAESGIDRRRERSRALADELSALLGGQGNSPKEIQQQLERVNATIADLKGQIENRIDREITPAMPTELLGMVASQLSGEEARAQWEEGKQKVEPQKHRLIDRLLGTAAPQPSPALDPDQIAFFRGRIAFEWDDLFNPPPEGIAETVLHRYLSNEERGQVRTKCSQVLTGAATDLLDLLNQLDAAERKARNLRQQMERIADTDRANEIIEEKSQVDRDLGEALEACDALRRRATSLSVDLTEVRRNLQNKLDQLVETGKSKERTAFVRKIKRVIEQYQSTLRPRKRDEVASYLTEMYRSLARKEDVIERIVLNERDYRPQLLDRRGNSVPLHTLSAGEREIYSLSLLWALGKTSQRALPIIIDTPLARLDSEHRANIVRRYLPNAGPQVIVLSTDTEIDREYFAMIQDRLAATLRLEFDPVTERTTVQDGYFDFD